jgi:hypothetical protein
MYIQVITLCHLGPICSLVMYFEFYEGISPSEGHMSSNPSLLKSSPFHYLWYESHQYYYRYCYMNILYFADIISLTT